MKRRPWLLRSTPPSPRTPSVTRMPRTLGGQTMPGGMELHELHVLQRGAGVVGQRVAVAGVLPAVAGDRVRPADPAGREHDRLGAEEPEPPALAVVAERARDAPAAR